MAERVEAIVKPELLIWARKSIGLNTSLAAKKLGATEQRLIKWEKGELRPTISQLRKMGEVYKRPIAIFYLPAPPRGFDPIKDFRQISKHEAPELSSTLLYEIRRAYARRESAIDLYKDINSSMPPNDLLKKISTDAEIAGQEIREFLGITYEKQKKWKTDRESFNGWRSAIESKNILVFQASRISANEMHGFSISKSPFPVIVVNIQDAFVWRTFTLLHELVHIIMGREGICDLTGTADIEVLGNAIAESILIPKNAFLEEREFKNRKDANWTDQEIHRLASRYRVSAELILRRLHTLGRISLSFYREKSIDYKEQAKDKMLKAKKRKGFAPPDRMVLSYSGKLYSRLVLNSYHHEKISASDVSDLLAVKLNYLSKIETALYG